MISDLYKPCLALAYADSPTHQVGHVFGALQRPAFARSISVRATTIGIMAGISIKKPFHTVLKHDRGIFVRSTMGMLSECNNMQTLFIVIYIFSRTV
jgi:hypothetical protein